MKKLLPLLLIPALWGCEKDQQPDYDNDPEVITGVKLTMSPAGGITDAVFSYSDPDGAGGSDPTVKTDTLFSNTTYAIRVDVLNETESPADTLNREILEEAEDHQFFLSFDPEMNIQTSYRDADIDGDPLGLEMQLVTDTTTGLSDMTLLLIHEPLKDAKDVAAGDPSHADGDIDLQVSWEVYIQ